MHSGIPRQRQSRNTGILRGVISCISGISATLDAVAQPLLKKFSAVIGKLLRLKLQKRRTYIDPDRL